MPGTANDALGGRLPLCEPKTLTGPQRILYDSIVEEMAPWGQRTGFKMVTADGRLIGPFNAFLLNPEITRALLAFDAALKRHVSFSERVREVIILAVGGVWESKYELYSHSIMGRNAGLSAAAISSLSSGDLPQDLASGDPFNDKLVGPSSLYWAPKAEGRVAYVTTDGGLLAPGPDGIVHPPALLRFTIHDGRPRRNSLIERCLQVYGNAGMSPPGPALYLC